MRRDLRQGERVDLWFDLDRLYLFDPDDGSALGSRHDAGAQADTIVGGAATGSSPGDGQVRAARVG
jgi:hypothetical protein